MILIGRGLDFDAKSERLIGKRLRKFRSRMLCSCQGVREKDKFTISGDDGEGVPPVPIPNTEVKPFSADGTWLETARESRSPPVSNTDMRNKRFAFCHSSVAQWQSTRLLTELLQVRVPPGEPFRVITVKGYHPVLYLIIISMAERNARECRPRIPLAFALSCPAKSRSWVS